MVELPDDTLDRGNGRFCGCHVAQQVDKLLWSFGVMRGQDRLKAVIELRQSDTARPGSRRAAECLEIVRQRQVPFVAAMTPLMLTEALSAFKGRFFAAQPPNSPPGRGSILLT